MDNVYLVLPSEEHGQSYIDMMTEWEGTGEHIYPGAIKRKGMNYSDWLDVVKSYNHRETCPPHLVPSDTYFLVDDNKKILGAISIRHYLSESLLNTGGHIGYGIRPTERRKGYAKTMLKMALEKCVKLNIEKVLVTCDKINIASAKTILANGGILENEVVEDDGNVVQRYWINVSDLCVQREKLPMKLVQNNLYNGIMALPSFPVVFVTVERNIMVAAAFHFYSFNPPSVMVGIKPEKYTYELITSNKEFVINIPTKEQLDKIHICGTISGRHEDKYHKASLTPQKGNKVDSYIIKECPVNIECQVVHQIDYKGSHKWFIGEIREVHIDENYVRDDALMFWLGQFRSVGDIIEGACNKDILKR